MRYCSSCNISVEGEHLHCPLCQNELMGEAGIRVYPSMHSLKKKNLLYKLQLFILLSGMVICLAAEFLLDVKCSFHWSLLVTTWVLGGEIWLIRMIKRHKNPSQIITSVGWWTSLLVFLTFYIISLHPIYLTWVLPGLAIVCETLHFIYMMIDKSQNAMAYLLGCSLLCVILGVFLILFMKEIMLLWVVCILIGVIAIIGAVVFKGRSVTVELEKRFHV